MARWWEELTLAEKQAYADLGRAARRLKKAMRAARKKNKRDRVAKGEEGTTNGQ